MNVPRYSGLKMVLYYKYRNGVPIQAIMSEYKYETDLYKLAVIKQDENGAWNLTYEWATENRISPHPLYWLKPGDIMEKMAYDYCTQQWYWRKGYVFERYKDSVFFCIRDFVSGGTTMFSMPTVNSGTLFRLDKDFDRKKVYGEQNA